MYTYAVTLDQRNSRTAESLVGPWRDQLNEEFVAGLRLPFVTTVGDEIQALFSDPSALVHVVLRALETRAWWIGVGLGEAGALGDTARDSRGPVFVNARAAVETAKSRSWVCAVDGEPEWAATALDGCLAMLDRIRRARTARGSELVKLAMAGATQSELAQDLRISRQAVSKQLRNAGFVEERKGREAAVALLTGLRD